jgi:hypothetical protein
MIIKGIPEALGTDSPYQSLTKYALKYEEKQDG